MTFAKKALCFGILGSMAAGLAASAQATLNGAGASFPAPFYQSAFASLAGQGTKVNYQSVGSGAGVRQFLKGTVDFGATDEPIKASDAAKVKRGVIQFPSVGGTIAVAFNKADCADLKLTQKQVVDVFLGRLKPGMPSSAARGRSPSSTARMVPAPLSLSQTPSPLSLLPGILAPRRA
jgi:phosphate transport system substrate-binding protein